MKKIYAAILIVMIVLVFGCGCQQTTKPKEPQTKETEGKTETKSLKLAVLKGPTALGILPIIDNPKLDNGTKIEVEVLPSPDVLMGRLLSGELDFATVPTNLAAKLYGKNKTYSMIAMNTWGSMYIVGKDTTIKTLDDLKNKKLYNTGKGTTPDILMGYLLKQKGIDAQKDLTIDTSLPPLELAQATAVGKVELAVLPEPFVTKVLETNKDIHMLMNVQTLYQEATGQKDVDIAQTCLVVKASLLKKNPELVKAFMDSYEKSLNSVTKDPKQGAILAEKYDVIKPIAAAEKAIPRSGIRYQSAQEAKSAVEMYLKILLDNAPESIGGKMPDEGFYILEY